MGAILDPLLLAFVFVGLFTPGPNVIMLTASGARFGFRASLPHLGGVVLGVGITAGVTGLGIGALVLASPVLHTILTLAAAAFILHMAWSYWRAAGRPAAQAGARPMRLWAAAAFQWINPKVWAVAFAAAAGYGAGLPPVAEGLRLGLVFSATNLVVCLFWVAAGTLLTALLSAPRAWRLFLRAMAVLLALSAILVFV
ncbi:MAG: putative threonine efflux protein [Rhodobacteraceae bacterium HLUCCA12]|nr:MAG: putative threonine efflux protein [Rhodobacteraceae bacterium HLUCCA12]